MKQKNSFAQDKRQELTDNMCVVGLVEPVAQSVHSTSGLHSYEPYNQNLPAEVIPASADLHCTRPRELHEEFTKGFPCPAATGQADLTSTLFSSATCQVTPA